jgi:hypothetical protein
MMPAGNSPEGICDMADNAMEYVDGWWDALSHTVRHDEPDYGRAVAPLRIVKGGFLVAHFYPWTKRYVDARDIDEMSPEAVGVRCAK